MKFYLFIAISFNILRKEPLNSGMNSKIYFSVKMSILSKKESFVAQIYFICLLPINAYLNYDGYKQ